MKKARLLLGASLVLILSAASPGASAQAAAEYGMAAASSATSTSSVASVYGQRLNTHRMNSANSGKTYRPGGATATHGVTHQKNGRSTVAATGLSGHGPQSGRAVDGASPAERTLGTSEGGLTVVGEKPRVGAEPQ